MIPAEKTKKMGAINLVISNNINSPLINQSDFFFNINAAIKTIQKYP